jgi:hypothetical protein
MRNESSPVVVNEFVRDLNDDDLDYLKVAVFSRPVAYLSEFCDLMSRDREINHFLETARTSDEFFERLDEIENAVFTELNARDDFRRQKEQKKKAPKQEAVA